MIRWFHHDDYVDHPELVDWRLRDGHVQKNVALTIQSLWILRPRRCFVRRRRAQTPSQPHETSTCSNGRHGFKFFPLLILLQLDCLRAGQRPDRSNKVLGGECDGRCPCHKFWGPKSEMAWLTTSGWGPAGFHPPPPTLEMLTQAPIFF